MQPKIIAASVAAALSGLVSLPAAAQTQPDSPYYLSFGAGWSSPPDWNFYDSISRHHIFHQDDGMPARIAFGRRFSSFRAEIEYAQAQFGFGPRTQNGVVIQQFAGNEDRKTWSLNGYYEFYSAANLSAHVGLGIGSVKVSWDMADVTAPNIYGRDSDTVSAYRLILGFDWTINRNWLLGMDYRREVSGDISITDSNGVTQRFGGKDQDSVLVNLTYRF